jgi:hypothetical protein
MVEAAESKGRRSDARVPLRDANLPRIRLQAFENLDRATSLPVPLRAAESAGPGNRRATEPRGSIRLDCPILFRIARW